MRWPQIVMNLAKEFALDTDELRKTHAATLVSHGYDMLALEVCVWHSCSGGTCMHIIPKF